MAGSSSVVAVEPSQAGLSRPQCAIRPVTGGRRSQHGVTDSVISSGTSIKLQRPRVTSATLAY
ncbi:hypothetical protein E2C01_065998 [Portunus trituberculatus]|uniref:Uncharacterized protein n=1 Tax=Portunus trituberculatus TaxID=210409 RepID=A0A5B7HKC1_PORTR|nr:hypothetical protein [Portunus trituberculatus]